MAVDDDASERQPEQSTRIGGMRLTTSLHDRLRRETYERGPRVSQNDILVEALTEYFAGMRLTTSLHDRLRRETYERGPRVSQNDILVEALTEYFAARDRQPR